MEEVDAAAAEEAWADDGVDAFSALSSTLELRRRALKGFPQRCLKFPLGWEVGTEEVAVEVELG